MKIKDLKKVFKNAKVLVYKKGEELYSFLGPLLNISEKWLELEIVKIEQVDMYLHIEVKDGN